MHYMRVLHDSVSFCHAVDAWSEAPPDMCNTSIIISMQINIILLLIRVILMNVLANCRS